MHEIRKQAMLATYATVRPLVRALAPRFPKEAVMLDAGSGECLIALKMAEDFGAKKIILVDHISHPKVELPPHAEFCQMDVQTPAFLHKFQNNVTIVTSFNAIHEFDNPFVAITNMLSVLPIGGRALFFEYTEQGWETQRRLLGVHNRHLQSDMQRARKFGYDTDAGITEFWEKRVFPYIPGNCILSLNGDLYIVLYTARQWGEVKQLPED